MIRIKKSETADTRTCDFGKVSKEQLIKSTQSHIGDVRLALDYFSSCLTDCAAKHDFTKIKYIDSFYNDFKTGFKQTEWWNNHIKIERHHLSLMDGRREDIDLVDVIEYISDCVMAGMARSGSVYDITIPPEVLTKAFKNTTEKLKSQVEVI